MLNLARSRWRVPRHARLEDWAGGRLVAHPLVIDVEPSPEVVHEVRQLHALVTGAIGSLPVEQRDTVEMHHVEG